MQCIAEWTSTKVAKHQPPQCPLCLRTYHYIIHECDGYYFTREPIITSGAIATISPQSSSSSAFQMTAAHRRRRCIYINNNDSNNPDTNEIQISKMTAARVNREDVLPWLTRELQAIMLQTDVSLIAAHILGTLKHAMKMNNDTHDDVVDYMYTAAQPYICRRYCSTFVHEFMKFVQSGSSMLMYNDTCIHSDDT